MFLEAATMCTIDKRDEKMIRGGVMNPGEDSIIPSQFKRKRELLCDAGRRVWMYLLTFLMNTPKLLRNNMGVWIKRPHKE